MHPCGISRASFVASLAALVASPSRAAAITPFADLADLARHRSAIARVKVYSIPTDISTMIAVTPSALETFHGVRVRTSGSRSRIDGLIDALVLAKPTSDSGPFDARFGVIFEDRSGRRRFAAYTNGGASRGMLGRHCVAFDDATPLALALRSASR